MNNLYDKLYNAINEGIQKILIIDGQDNVSVNYSHNKINNYVDPLLLIRQDFVDLGLPSGTLWCDHNLGATCENDPESWYGNYYAWGEIETKKEYTWKTYKWIDDKGEKIVKYNTRYETGSIHLTTLLPEDDIIQIEYSKVHNSKIAEKVKMPAKKQLGELKKYTDNKWITNYKGINGLNGRIFIGSNGNYIFIPAAGCFGDSQLRDTAFNCNMWSSFIDLHSTKTAYCLSFSSRHISVDNDSRYHGFSVRGVYSKFK